MAKRVTKLSVSEMTAKRRVTVAALVKAGKDTAQIVTDLRTQGIVNPRTGKSFSRQTIKADIFEVTKPRQERIVDGKRVFRRPLAETIGQWTYTKPNWPSRVLLSVDTTWKDYVFWDALRRGTAPGYELGGLFCMPSAQTIASHVLGAGISASLLQPSVPAEKRVTKFSVNEDGKPTTNTKNSNKPSLAKIQPDSGDPIAYTNAQLKRMMERNQGFFLQVLVDLYCLGNQYVICNPDCTFSIASPDTVTVEYSASDYRRPVRYIIRTRMQTARVEDIYTDDKRIVIIRYYDAERGTVKHEYENLIGRIPIVHFPNDRSANEIYGRPIYEAALPIMRSYDDLIYNIVEGVKLLGNPIPAFTGLDNPSETKALNSDAVTYEDADGNVQTEYVTRFDRNAGLYIGKGGDAKMLSTPVGFTKDSLDTLRQLFLLYLSHIRIPEFMWGGAIASSKASADTQLPPFIQYIKFRRLMLEGEGADPLLGIEARGGILEVLDIWLRTYKLLNPAIIVGPVELHWPSIDIQNDQNKYLWGTYLNGTGQLSPQDTLDLAGFWSDPAAVSARAAGKQARPVEFDAYEEKLNKARLEAARKSMQPPDDGTLFSTDYVPLDGKEDDVDVLNPFGSLPWQHMFSGASW